MRVLIQPHVGSSDFPKLLLDLEKGKVPSVQNEIDIPNGLGKIVSNMENLISSFYPNLKDLSAVSSDWFCERSILSPKNDMVSIINDKLLIGCEGEGMMYSSLNCQDYLRTK